MRQDMHAIPELDRQGLREFGLVTGGIFMLLFGLLLPWLFGFNFPLWPWVLGAILSTWALLAAASLKPVYYGWMRFALLLSRITTPIILGVVFYLVIWPTGLIARLFGYDPMARRLDESKKTYRVPSNKAPRQNMEKPY